MKTKHLLRFLPLLMVTAPLAQAHPGHGPADFASGFTHPFSGWDHLLAMVAVGLWAAQLGRLSRFAIPACFIVAMALGATAGVGGWAPGAPEGGVLASVFILGLLLAAGMSVPPWAGILLCSFAGAFHGFAHGAEMPAHAGSAMFLGGMIAATAILHGAGLAVGAIAGNRRPAAVQWAGAGILAAATVFCLAK